MSMGWGSPQTRQLHYYLDDALGMQASHGNYSGVSEHFESNIGAWAWGSWGIAPIVDLQSGSGASDNYLRSQLFVSTRGVSSHRVATYMWDWYGLNWVDWGQPATSFTMGATGASLGPGEDAHGFATSNETQVAVAKVTGRSLQTDPATSTWSFGSQSTMAQGMDGAYDAKSGSLVEASLTTDHEIVLVVDDGSGGYSHLLLESGKPIESIAPPTVACGPPDIDRNCIIVWVSSRPREPRYFRWFQFRITPALGLDSSSIMTGGYLMFDRPQVAYAGDTATSGSFVLAFPGISTPSGDRWVITVNKPSDETAEWKYDEFVHHVPSRGNVGYALGSSIGWGELLIHYTPSQE